MAAKLVTKKLKRAPLAESGLVDPVSAVRPASVFVLLSPVSALLSPAPASVPRDVVSVLKDQQNKVVFFATLRGGRVDFARFHTAVLLARPQEIKASFTQNERTALRGEDGQYTARCLYVFPAEGVDPRASLTLRVRDNNEKVVAKFTVDLSTMR